MNTMTIFLLLAWTLVVSGFSQSQPFITKKILFSLVKKIDRPRKRNWWWTRQRKMETKNLDFSYDFDQMQVGKSKTKNATGVVLVHPIGVGIGKWYYNRLLTELSGKNIETPKSLIIVVPDLLGSGTACNPTEDKIELTSRLPLLNMTDWTDQIVHIMSDVEKCHPEIANWAVVANGGCSPIALQVGQRSIEGSCYPAKKNVTNIILSSLPSLPFFLSSSDPVAVAKSYNILCGMAGRIFWWYSCRKNGRFIQKFSEKNLVADPITLGKSWRRNCVLLAKMYRGKSRYSTFAFLSGNLQDGCQKSLAVLKKSGIIIGIIKGRDTRQNRAKSWFWKRPKKQKNNSDIKIDQGNKTLKVPVPRQTFRDFAERNGNGGREIVIGGRISLAHEDAPGYANALIDLLQDAHVP